MAALPHAAASYSLSHSLSLASWWGQGLGPSAPCVDSVGLGGSVPLPYGATGCRYGAEGVSPSPL